MVNKTDKSISRRDFIATGAAIAGTAMLNPLSAMQKVGAGTAAAKMRIAIVGTGHRSLNMWSKDVAETYPDKVEYVGLCDVNPGRAEYFKKATGFTCNTYTDFEKMV